MTGDPTQVELPMVCTCAPENAVRVRELRSSVKARLSAGSEALRPFPVTDANFLSQLCLSLRADLDAHIAGIYLDQWFAVVVEQRTSSGNVRRVVVQADEAEDGLAAIWDHLNAETGPRATGSGPR